MLAATARLDQLGPDSWRAAQVAAAATEQRWNDPDAGLWEQAAPRLPWGSLPQAFVRAAVLEAAVRLSGPAGGDGQPS